MRIVETWDISSWSLFFSEHGKQLQIGHHEESKNSFFLAFDLAFCTKLGLPNPSYSCHSMMSQKFKKVVSPKDTQSIKGHTIGVYNHYRYFKILPTRANKVKFSKSYILLLQQVKVPIWAVEKQYYEMPELHSCRKGTYNSKFFCKNFWSQIVH